MSQGPSGRGRSNCSNNHRIYLITDKYSFEEKMKDSPISKLIITETGHRPTQYKKVIDTLPVLCTDKNYRGLDDIIQNKIDLAKANFTPPYPNTNRWSTIHHVKVRTVNAADAAAAANCLRTSTITMTWQTHVFDTNL